MVSAGSDQHTSSPDKGDMENIARSGIRLDTALQQSRRRVDILLAGLTRAMLRHAATELSI